MLVTVCLKCVFVNCLRTGTFQDLHFQLFFLSRFVDGDILGCLRIGLSTNRDVDESGCRRIGLSANRHVISESIAVVFSRKSAVKTP